MAPIKILIVDDEQVICNGCRMILSDLGYTVDTCNTCKEGLDAIRKTKYHLILLDMKLPDSDGMEILKTVLRRKTKNVHYCHDRLLNDQKCGFSHEARSI